MFNRREKNVLYIKPIIVCIQGLSMEIILQN